MQLVGIPPCVHASATSLGLPLRISRRAWILGDRSHSASADRAYRPQVGPVRVQIGAIGRIGALGPAVGNDILCALTWCAALTMGYAATCRFARIFR